MDAAYPSRSLPKLPSFSEALPLLQQIARDRQVRIAHPVDKPLFLYGGGSMGRMARCYFARLDIPLRGVVDINAQQLRNDPFWSGIPLWAPDEITPEMQRDSLLALCIVTAPYTPLAKNIAATGWSDIVPFYDIAEHYRDRHPLSNGWFASPFSSEDETNIAAALRHWADDLSRAHHLQFLAWRRLRQEWTFPNAHIDNGNRFFIPEVNAALGPRERFLDVGSHVGTVVERFLQQTQGQFEHIWAIEPDPRNLLELGKLHARMDESERGKMDLLPVAITNADGDCRFIGGLGYASQCSDLTEQRTPCRTIDSLGIDPSFVKLHVEGMELAALRGATDTLSRHRPILTLTVYHNEDGLWKTPLWLAENLPDYALLLRLHSWCGTGATVYALPRERLTGTPAILGTGEHLAAPGNLPG